MKDEERLKIENIISHNEASINDKEMNTDVYEIQTAGLLIMSIELLSGVTRFSPKDAIFYILIVFGITSSFLTVHRARRLMYLISMTNILKRENYNLQQDYIAKYSKKNEEQEEETIKPDMK